jgi:hypothetical protein
MIERTPGAITVTTAMFAIGSALLRAVQRVRSTAANGASAIELAVIAAVLVAVATGIGYIVVQVVNQKGQELQDCANQPVGGQCGVGGAP